MVAFPAQETGPPGRAPAPTRRMSILPFHALACPLDGGALQRDGDRWRCTSGHSFDVARQGYIHLLPVQNKRSRDPGDSKEMVAARRRFLGSGVYQPIADRVAHALLAELPEPTTLRCLDAGCGEGHYLRQLATAAEQAGHGLTLLGLDISKWAVLAAAKQDPRPAWVVGSNANLPVLSGTLDRVLCMFGFPVYPEFARVLKPGGELLQVDAGPDHLRELREIIYPMLKPERPAKLQAPAGFGMLPGSTLRQALELDHPEQIADLLLMTPHLFRATAAGRARAAALSSLRLTIDVRLTRYIRHAAC